MSALSDFKIYNVEPRVKPVVRILADGMPVIVSADCFIAREIANNYCAYVKFLMASCGMVLIKYNGGCDDC